VIYIKPKSKYLSRL